MEMSPVCDLTVRSDHMGQITRYAIYYAPAPGVFADAAAAWLGWDAARGVAAAQPAAPGLDLDALTRTPRKYGFHGTLKAPFALADGRDAAALAAALGDFAALRPPAESGPLVFRRIGSFLALTPAPPLGTLNRLAGEIVEAFEPFRAPLTPAQTARRRPERLTDRQRELLDLYGYPYVMDEFRFHLTLTGPMTREAEAAESAARNWFAPHLSGPFRVEALSLFGEDETGRFHLLSRHALTG